MDPKKYPDSPGEGARTGYTSPAGTSAGQVGHMDLTSPTRPMTTNSGTTGNSSPTQDQSAVDKAKETASNVASQAKDAASSVVSQAQGAVQPQVESQKARAADQLGSLADAARETSQKLHQKYQHGVADVVDKGADRIEYVANYLRNHDLGQVVDDVENYSRRQPAMFVGGALALGFIAARFLKSSREKAYQSRGYDNSYPIYRTTGQMTSRSTQSSGYPWSGSQETSYPESHQRVTE
jgi:hypothetical protein